jgi:hypothetical protein
MKNIFKNTITKALLSTTLLFALGCQREISELEQATYPTTAEIFTDDFIGMGTNFYFPFVGDGAKPDVFSVDKTQGANSSKASIRIDVPNANDPTGSFAGAIFIVDGMARDLSKYNALTFYAKASQNVNIGTIGFGESTYQVKMDNAPFTTNWVKYIIPIPDAAKLIAEKGMFLFSAGTQNTNNLGYSFWIDELKFENVGTISFQNAAIVNGTNKTVTSFIGVTNKVDGLKVNFSMPNGATQALNTTPYYFNFASSNPSVATVNEKGEVATLAAGTSTITATLAGKPATGSLIINSLGTFINAPDPTVNPANVISIFSDTYSNVPGFNLGIFAGPNTQNIANFNINNNNHLRFQGIDYVGLGWTGTVNASTKTMMHMDVQLVSGSNLVVELKDFGADGVDGGTGDTSGGRNISSVLTQGQWKGIDMPLTGFTLPTGGGGTGNPNRNKLGYVIFVSNNGATFLVDNIYFY